MAPARADSGFCVVANDQGVVLGLVQGRLDAAAGDKAEQVMDFGITTIRPAEQVGPLVERTRHAQVEAILFTRSRGTLYGILAATRPPPPRPSASSKR